MNSFDIQFSSPLLLLAILPATAAIWLISRRSRFRRRWQQRVARMLCCTAALLICCVLAGMTVTTHQTATELTILWDRSVSMQRPPEGMDKQLQQLTKLADSYAAARIIPFAGNHTEGVPITETLSLEALPLPCFSAATNIEDALIAAQEASTRNTRQHIVLLTDGLETAGDAFTRARLLANKGGTVIDALYLPTLPETAEAQITDLLLPQAVSLSETCRATVRIVSNEGMRCKLELFDGETEILERNVTVKAGVNEFSYKISPAGSGLRTIVAVIQPHKDVIAENNRQSVCLEVLTSNSILLIEGHAGEGDLLHALLAEGGYEVTRIAPGKMPRTAAELGRYNMTLLLNVDQGALPAHSDQLLEQYAKEYGRSVLVVGGMSTLAYGNMLGTAFDAFLPVSLEVTSKASREPVALYLLIDNSASMGESISRMLIDTNTPSQMSKAGAIKCLQLLNDNDYVGVISFSETATHLVPLTSAANRIEITNELARMGVRDGTAFCPALYMAFDSLMAFDGATQKHVIMITDGNPSDAGYEDIVSAMYRQGITVSTITVGHTSKPETARTIARLGGGTAHVAQNAMDLPDMMVSDTMLYQADYTVQESFTPTPSGSLPPLYGYIRTGAKTGAEVQWTAIDGDPLFACWDYGAGRVGVFTSDWSGNWSRDWFDTQEGRQAILDIIDDLKPDAYVQSALKAKIDYDGVNCLLRITSDNETDESFDVAVTAPDGTTTVLHPMKARRGVYEASFGYSGSGQYLLSIRNVNTGSVTETAATVAWSPEYNAFPAQDGKALLNAICEVAHGQVATAAASIQPILPEDTAVTVDPVEYLLAAALLCFLGSIVFRRWKT